LKHLRAELYMATLHFQLMEVVDWNEIEARAEGSSIPDISGARNAMVQPVIPDNRPNFSRRGKCINPRSRYTAIRLLRNTREFGECRA